MKFKRKKWGSATIVALIIFSLSRSLYAVDDTRYEDIKQAPDRLLETGKSIIGQPLSYPTDGPPKITAMIVTIAPGEKTQVHKHPVPLFVYILSVEIVVKYEGKGTKRFAAGDAYMEAVDWWHKGKNDGDVPVRILIVYIGSEKLPNVIPK